MKKDQGFNFELTSSKSTKDLPKFKPVDEHACTSILLF